MKISQSATDRYGNLPVGLIRSALGILESNEPEGRQRALWRLTEAAGLLVDSLRRDKVNDVVGMDQPTGRGFQVTRKPTADRKRGPDSIPAWKVYE